METVFLVLVAAVLVSLALWAIVLSGAGLGALVINAWAVLRLAFEAVTAIPAFLRSLRRRA